MIYLAIDYQSVAHRDCSEQFYKECVQEELGTVEATKESKERMMNILNRMNEQQEEEEEDSDDDDDPVDLEERMRGVNLDDPDELWSRLTEDERREFDSLAKSGDVGSVLPEYRPWWSIKVQSRKIRDLDQEEEEEETFMENCPPVEKEIAQLSQLCRHPSEFIKFGIFNILYGYAYGVKFLLGDYEEETLDLVNIVQLLSKNLSGHNYSEVDTALESAASEVNNHPQLTISLQFSRQVKRDVLEIIRGPGLSGSHSYYAMAALSDLKRLFSKAGKSLKKVAKQEKISPDLPVWLQNNRTKPQLKPEEVKRNLKKIEFYLSWCQEHYLDLRRLIE